jgi:hypothetical protein
MSLWKKMLPLLFCRNSMEIVGQIGPFLLLLPITINYPISKNSPNLVTLAAVNMKIF